MGQHELYDKKAFENWRLLHAVGLNVTHNYTYTPEGVTLTQELEYDFALPTLPVFAEQGEVTFAGERVLSTTVQKGDDEVTKYHDCDDWGASGSLDGTVGNIAEALDWQNAAMGWADHKWTTADQYWLDYGMCFDVVESTLMLEKPVRFGPDVENAPETMRKLWNERLLKAVSGVTVHGLTFGEMVYTLHNETLKEWADLGDTARSQFVLWFAKIAYDGMWGLEIEKKLKAA